MPAPSRAMYLKRMVPRGSPSTMPGGARADRVRADGGGRIGEDLHDRGAGPDVHHPADEPVGRDDRGHPGHVIGATAVHGERAHPAAPLAGDDLAGQGLQRHAALEREQPAQAPVLLDRLGHLQRLHPQLLRLVTQPAVLGAHVLPIAIGRPHADRRRG